MIAQVVYHDVPTDVSRVTAYQWHPQSRPAPLLVSMTRLSGALVITLQATGSDVVFLLRRSDAAYLLDGPIPLTEPVVERRGIEEIWRHSVAGSGTAAATAAPPIAWISSTGVSGDPWPACWWSDATRWECLGVPIDAAGVAIAVDGARVLWGAVVDGGTPVLRASAWGRLFISKDEGPGAPPRLRISGARPVDPRTQRGATLRLETGVLTDLVTTPIAADAMWVAGDSSPPAAWLEVRSARSGPEYVTVAEVSQGSPFVPVHVALTETRIVAASVTSNGGEPAGGALVTTFRLIDPATARRDSGRPPPRRVFATETIADADGALRIDGLGNAEYEVVAWHPRFGRASMLLPAGAARVTIRVQSPGIARGRVLAGGKPAAGVSVISMPDPGAFAGAADPIDLKGGDTRTTQDGRFAVALAPGGGGELRVGGGAFAVRRVPLPHAPLPLVELGDVELGGAITVDLVLDQDPGCALRATGPIGRSGLQIVGAIRTGPGLFTLQLPEEGAWEIGLLCGSGERAVAPAVITVTASERPRSVQLSVR